MRDRRHLLLIPLCLLAGLLAGPLAAATDAPPPSGLTAETLIELVPERTAYVWHHQPDAQTRLAEGYALEVVDAVLAARFDEFLLESLEKVGLDEGIRLQLASVRNMVESVGSIVPWRSIVGREFVYAESLDPPVSTDFGIPSALLVCRPMPGQREELVNSLAGVFGALAGLGSPLVRYDITHEPGANGHGPTRYRLCAPAFGEAEILQMGVYEDVLMIGMGSDYFDWGYDLLRGGEGSRLIDSPRFQQSWGELPLDAPSLTWVDMDAFVLGLADARTMLLQRDFAGGALQGLVGEAFDLAGAVDTVATATHCDGTRVITETLTRFDPEVATRQPLLRASLATPASPELLDYVPVDAISFSMRGQVDLVPLHQRATQQLLATWDGAELALWCLDTLQAAVDLSIERDLLSWLGSEHITINLPSQRIPGEVDSVTFCKLRDPRGGRKILARIEAVYNAAAPQVMEALQSKLREVGSPIIPEVHLGLSEGLFPNLRELRIAAGPIPIPKITFGMLGDVLVISTSRDAIETCMMVAAGEEDGLAEHALVADLVGRDDLTGAHLHPYGRQMQETAAGFASMGGIVRSVLGPASQDHREVAIFLDIFGDFMDRLMGVLEVVDFLDEALVMSASREGGLARYERRTVQLIEPDKRASYGTRARAPTPEPEAQPEPEALGVTRR